MKVNTSDLDQGRLVNKKPNRFKEDCYALLILAIIIYLLHAFK